MPKLTLDKTWTYGGKFYGPGEVDIEDEAAGKAIVAKMAAEAKAAKAEASGVAPDAPAKKG